MWGDVDTRSTTQPTAIRPKKKTRKKRRTLTMNHGIVLDSVCCCVPKSPSFILVNQQSSWGATVTAAALLVTNSGATWLQIFITRIHSTNVLVECPPAALPTPRKLQVKSSSLCQPTRSLLAPSLSHPRKNTTTPKTLVMSFFSHHFRFIVH